MPNWIFGMIALAWVGSAVLWAMSGTSPFVWIAWLFLHLEAIRVQVPKSLAAAVWHFRNSYSIRRREATAEVGMLMLASDHDDHSYGPDLQYEPDAEDMEVRT